MRLDWRSIQAAIQQLQQDYKFDPYKILEIVKLGIKSGFKKDFPEFKKSNIEVDIKWDGSVAIFKAMEVVKEVEDAYTQIEISEAQKQKKDIKEGEKIFTNVTPESMELSRIAAQSAAQTIKQGLKNIEKERFYEKFQNKQGELLRAKVIRVHWDSAILDIEWSAVVLPAIWQMPHKDYEIWEEIFVLLKKISKDSGGITLDITQSTPDYIEAILKKIVPELEEWIVEIKKIVRIAGIKTKILISSNDEKIDPIGVMVWHQGDRINTVLSLLDGEKIDYIEFIDDEIELLKKCLKPAKIDNVEIKDGKAFVHMDESQKALAIWKRASNVKLAAQITWLTIEVV